MTEKNIYAWSDVNQLGLFYTVDSNVRLLQRDTPTEERSKQNTIQRSSLLLGGQN